MKLSVVIITFNEEKNIGRCIDSVADVADEIIVLDSMSTDRTAEIVRTKNATLHIQAFLGYVEQKNKALTLASNDHVLSLDADEALDPTLLDTIRTLKSTGFSGAYEMNRCTNYCGKFIRHGSWYPDRKVRLFNRNEAAWGGDNPHDRIILKDGVQLRLIKGDILHYSYHSIEEHVLQNNKFSTISADTLFKRGKKTNLFKIIVHPAWAFFVGFFIRKGFLDGFYGLVISRQVAHLSFLKHVKLYLKQKSSSLVSS
ncbi:MAG TPA: glycosyltransferase family 2 protein [Flavitalea sp.]|nr:glycosyltransferase family 2 protein [Flavitalea sp.]